MTFGWSSQPRKPDPGMVMRYRFCGRREPRIVQFNSVRFREQPQRGRRIRRAAADPCRDRQSFFQREQPRFDVGHRGAELAHRFQHQIGFSRTARGPERPGSRSASSTSCPTCWRA